MKPILPLACILLLSSCTQRGCQKTAKSFQYTDRTYEVTVYSGGVVIHHDFFKGIVNGEEATDGFFYFKNDSLYEISGDYVLKSAD